MNKVAIIVEDEFIVADNLRLIAQKAGYTVPGIAESVEEAHRMLTLHQPGIVLLDINLKGDLTGIDLAMRLNEKAIPFIYISAYCTEGILAKANETHPFGFIVKPFRRMDVQVSLDIAAYRYDNNVESALRRDEILDRSLRDISSGSEAPKLKLLKATKALQSQIPFDYLVMGQRTELTNPFKGISFLREGLDDYKVISKHDLLLTTEMSSEAMSIMLRDHVAEEETVLYNAEDFATECERSPLKKVLCETFKLESNLVVPFRDENNKISFLSFYSRKRISYNADHIRSLERLADTLVSFSNAISLSDELQESSEQSAVYSFEGVVGNHPELLKILDLVRQVAPFDTSVLLLGETGTGKERLADAIHNLSGRASKPIVKVNCAALPKEIIESELFGHEKGAFTGAIEARIGKFEQAAGGTIFLDEIGELPLEVQAKLLRVLQEKEIERLGGRQTRPIDVRIIAATNRNLQKEVADGRFRLDLFYRLNVFPLVLPSLRQRRSDIKQLAVYFGERIAKRHKKRFHGIKDEMMLALLRYDWPGNVRELENVIEQSVVLNNNEGMLDLARPLSDDISTAMTPNDVQSLEDIKHIQRKTERDYIISILKNARGRIRGEEGAAQMLNLPPTTLESKMAKLGIKKEEYLR